LIVANTGDATIDFNISYSGKVLAAHLDKGSVGTYTWQ
jgi:glucosylceramidase